MLEKLNMKSNVCDHFDAQIALNSKNYCLKENALLCYWITRRVGTRFLSGEGVSSCKPHAKFIK